MYDVIVIGAGPAGLAAAAYTARHQLQTLLIAPDNQNFLPRLNLSFIAKTPQGGDGRHRHGCRFLKRYIGRFQG